MYDSTLNVKEIIQSHSRCYQMASLDHSQSLHFLFSIIRKCRGHCAFTGMKKVWQQNSSPSMQISSLINYWFSLQNVLNSIVLLFFCLSLCNQICVLFYNLCSQLQLFVILGGVLWFHVDLLKLEWVQTCEFWWISDTHIDARNVKPR